MHCSGKGVVRADESNSMLILRTVENEIYNNNYDIVNVYGIASSILYLLNNKREEINFIEKKYSIKLNFHIDRDATADSYSIEKIRLSEKNKSETMVKQPALQDIKEAQSENSLNRKQKPNNRRSQKNYLPKHNRPNEEESKPEIIAKDPVVESVEDKNHLQDNVSNGEVKIESSLDGQNKHNNKSRKRINRRRVNTTKTQNLESEVVDVNKD